MNPNKRQNSVFRMVYMMFSTYFAWFVYMNNKKVGLVWGCGNTTVKVPNITVFRFAVPLPFFDWVIGSTLAGSCWVLQSFAYGQA